MEAGTQRIAVQGEFDIEPCLLKRPYREVMGSCSQDLASKKVYRFFKLKWRT